MTDSANFSLTTFSPSGKLVQIEYALNAVSAGATSLGIKARGRGRADAPCSQLHGLSDACRAPQAKNGVVVATEKKLPSVLIDESTVQKARQLAHASFLCRARSGRELLQLLVQCSARVCCYHPCAAAVGRHSG